MRAFLELLRPLLPPVQSEFVKPGDEARRPFPFIVGCPRSGSTLLRLLLDGHPALAIPPESHFLIPIWRWRRRYQSGHGFDLQLFGTDLLTFWRFTDWGIDPDVVRSKFSGTEDCDFAEAMRRVYSLYAEAQGKRRYGDKTPTYLLHLPFIAEQFPEALFIHLIRDGRDVAMSTIESLPQSGLNTISKAAYYWAYRVRVGREFGSSLGTSRYLEVRYEDLVENPGGTLNDVCDFIGLDYVPEMLSNSTKMLDRVPPAQRVRHSHLGEPVKTGIRDWSRDMSAKDRLEFEAIAGSELQEFEYERSIHDIPLSARLIANVSTTTTKISGIVNRARSEFRLVRHRARLR